MGLSAIAAVNILLRAYDINAQLVLIMTFVDIVKKRSFIRDIRWRKLELREVGMKL